MRVVITYFISVEITVVLGVNVASIVVSVVVGTRSTLVIVL